MKENEEFKSDKMLQDEDLDMAVGGNGIQWAPLLQGAPQMLPLSPIANGKDPSQMSQVDPATTIAVTGLADKDPSQMSQVDSYLKPKLYSTR